MLPFLPPISRYELQNIQKNQLSVKVKLAHSDSHALVMNT